MEKYIKPEMQLKEFKAVEILTASAEDGGSEEQTTKSYTTPYIPIP